MKSNKRKVRKYLKCVKEYSRRFDVANEKYLPIFLDGSAGGGGRGGELYQIKRSRDKTEIGKEIIWYGVKKYLLKSPDHEIAIRH